MVTVLAKVTVADWIHQVMRKPPEYKLCWVYIHSGSIRNAQEPQETTLRWQFEWDLWPSALYLGRRGLWRPISPLKSLQVPLSFLCVVWEKKRNGGRGVGVIGALSKEENAKQGKDQRKMHIIIYAGPSFLIAGKYLVGLKPLGQRLWPRSAKTQKYWIPMDIYLTIRA